jgi:hypothetical protein
MHCVVAALPLPSQPKLQHRSRHVARACGVATGSLHGQCDVASRSLVDLSGGPTLGRTVGRFKKAFPASHVFTQQDSLTRAVQASFLSQRAAQALRWPPANRLSCLLLYCVAA